MILIILMCVCINDNINNINNNINNNEILM